MTIPIALADIPDPGTGPGLIVLGGELSSSEWSRITAENDERIRVYYLPENVAQRKYDAIQADLKKALDDDAAKIAESKSLADTALADAAAAKAAQQVTLDQYTAFVQSGSIGGSAATTPAADQWVKARTWLNDNGAMVIGLLGLALIIPVLVDRMRGGKRSDSR